MNGHRSPPCGWVDGAASLRALYSVGMALSQLSRAQYRAARKLTTRKGRDETGEFLVEGAQAVREALRRPDIVRAVLVEDPDRHAELLAMADPGRCWQVHASDLAGLSDAVTPQGIVAVCLRETTGLDDVPDPRLVVICAQIRDPGNAGTVIRCADAFGADAVVFTKGSVDIHNGKTVRASVGSLFHLPVVVGVDLADAVAWARSRGCAVLAAAGGGDRLDDLAASGGLRGAVAWVMGNEAWGLPEADRALADRVVGIPMWGRAESLNLSTAAAICLYTTAAEQNAGRPRG